MSRIGPALLLSLTLLTGCEPARQDLRMVAPSSSLDLEIVTKLAALLDEESGFRLDISPEQLTGETALDRLLAGEADIALVSNYLPYREGIATVMPLYASVLHIAYREGLDDSDGRSLLSNATVFAGEEGSASRLMFERVVASMDLAQDTLRFIDVLDRSAKPDILVLFAPISPDRAGELGGYRLFSIGSPADIGRGGAVDAVALLNPPLRPFIIPANTYGAVNVEPVVSVAVDKLLVVRNSLDPAVVYDLIGTIGRLRPAMAAARPGLIVKVGEEFDVSKSTFVLHEGTQDFLQREQPTIYERYSGVAEVVVTLMVALISAAIAGLRILKLRRKNRIDRFYSEAIAIRNSIASTATAHEREDAAEKIKALQDRAFDQLVSEKLSADESFRIFITLSNDILDGLKPAGQ